MDTTWRSRRAVLVLTLTFLLLAAGAAACDAPQQESPQPAAETGGTSKKTSSQTKKSADDKKQSAPKDRSFTLSAGRVAVRRLGFDVLRIVEVKASSGWRRRIDENFDDSVGVEFFKGTRNLDFSASLENGRLTAEACESFPRLSFRRTIANAGAVSIQRIGDEDLHVAVVKRSPGWQARITDNNSEDIEVLFVSNKGRIDFEAQLDDGRLEGSVCKRLT